MTSGQTAVAEYEVDEPAAAGDAEAEAGGGANAAWRCARWLQEVDGIFSCLADALCRVSESYVLQDEAAPHA